MREEGFRVNVHNTRNLGAIKQEHQVPFTLQSCHTAIVDGYVIEGHVPAADVERLLKERPSSILGIAVPGMPLGSPGMEGNGRNEEPYDVFTFDLAGNTTIYSSYTP